jgi:Domain of unknown function (DUF2019)
MMQKMIKTLSVTDLVKHFVIVALAQDQAIELDDNAKYNRLFDEMELVEAELKQRDGDKRHLLIPLLQHKNAQVRLKAAIALLAIDRVAAQRTLQTISDTNEYPQAADARGMLRAVAEGRYLPN